jgi:Na+/proline symporter
MFDPFGAALCLIIVGLFFARLVRRGKYLTLVDLFTIRYGKVMGTASGIAMAIAEIGWVGALLVGFGTVINFFTGIPLAWGIGISTTVLIIYTYLGGMLALTLTDALQMSIIIISMIAMLVVAVPLVGGWEHIFSNDPTHNFMGINQWAFLPISPSDASPEFKNAGFNYYTGYLGWFYWAASLMAIGFGSIAAQDLTQRLLSARDEKTGVRASIFGGILYLALGLIPVVLGMIAFKLYPDLKFEDIQNKILLIMAAEHLPVGLTILFVCGLVAALMSSAAAAILASASIIGYNGINMIKPDVDDQTTLKVTRILIPITAGVSLLLALRFETIYNLMVVSWSVLLVSLFIPYVAAFFWKKANSAGAISAFIMGFAIWIFAYFQYLPVTMEANTDVIPGVSGVYQDWAMWDALYIASVWGVLASLVSLIIVSLITQKSNPPLPLTDMAGNPLDRSGWFGLSSSKPRIGSEPGKELV